MRVGVVLAAVVGLGVFGGAAVRAEGSIAVDNRGRAGLSYNFRGERGADGRALEECGASYCHVVFRFRHLCGAVAGAGGASGWSARAEQREADRLAVEKCRENATERGCRVVARGCDD